MNCYKLLWVAINCYKFAIIVHNKLYKRHSPLWQVGQSATQAPLDRSAVLPGRKERTWLFPYNKLWDSFLSYQLVKAVLLVCMPALGDRITVGMDEIAKPLHAYVIF